MESPIALMVMAATSFSAGPWPLCAPTTIGDLIQRDNAVLAAELFIKENWLDTARICPPEQRVKDETRAYEVTELCPYYEASESTAARVVSIDEWGWRVYFLKSRVATDGALLYRVVEVYAPRANDTPAKVCLRDLEDSSL
jgi:hypothetical protein